MKLFINTIHRDQWQKFLRKFPVHVYKKGEIVLLYDEIPTALRIVKSGYVKVYNINSHGEERPVSFDYATDIFPLGWIFGKIEKTQYFYEAFTDCELYELPRKDFLLYLKLHPKIAYEMYASLASKVVSLQARIYALEQSRASEKVIRTLLYLCERFGVPYRRTNKTTLKLPLTQQDIANFIGITRETTSHELKRLEKIKAIKLTRKHYVVNIEKLNELITT